MVFNVFYSWPAELHLIGGFIIAVLVALTRAYVLGKPPETLRKFGDALLCGFAGCLSCIAAIHFNKLDPILTMPICGVYGYLGMIQVRAWILDIVRAIAKRQMNVELSSEYQQEKHK